MAVLHACVTMHTTLEWCFCIASSHKFLNGNASVHTARCMSIWSKVQSSNKMCFLWRGSTVLPHWFKPHSKLTHISCTPILHASPVYTAAHNYHSLQDLAAQHFAWECDAVEVWCYHTSSPSLQLVLLPLHPYCLQLEGTVELYY